MFDQGQPTDRAIIAERVLREIQERVRFLHDVGVGYLTLGRGAATLSGGEGSASALMIGAHLSGVLYVLDEPSIGCTSVTTASFSGRRRAARLRTP